MTTTTQPTYAQTVKERRSIRVYDPQVKISKEEMMEILDEAALAPSSLNLQPWRFLVIDSEEGKETLKDLAKFNQRQVETSSAVIAVFVDMQSIETTQEIYDLAVEKGVMPADVRDRQVPAIQNMLKDIPRPEMRAMNFIDAGLVSMQIMLSAQARGYATNPIGGFEKARIAEAYGLEKDRFEPVMLISIGKAAEEGYQSVRLPIENIAKWV
ncbi:nitroreductase family protein [Chryseomicrobium excrementi]|uniref:Nitroreductase family protein n=1 Tax=Chryseomicrobium excrementi TaxID=2041346 RepID=A0A2M9EYH6_9BACL|nr:nitroreductase family protein [Chryseomicrobium excrementi]PJK16263.1 nitroreductase family protein [Chryseomicrobium excrementi]